MAEKYHISPSTGNPNRCYASKKPCPLGGEADHYSSKEEARASFEKGQDSGLGGVKKAKKTPAAPKAASAPKSAPKPAAKVNAAPEEEPMVTVTSFDDLEFNPSDDFLEDDDLLKEKDYGLDDFAEDEVWDSSRMSADDYEERTNSFTYSWDR